MTTVTWTSAAPTFQALNIANTALPTIKKIGQFIAVFFGATADKDSNFRGLDMNGNAMWAARTQA